MGPPLCPPSAAAPAAAVNTVKKMLCAVQRGMWFCKQDFKPLPVCVHLFPMGRGGSRGNWGCQLVGLALEKGETSEKQVQQHREEHQESLVLLSSWCLGRVGWERGQSPSLSPPAQGDGPFPVTLMGWMALLQREVGGALMPHPLDIAPVRNKAQGCGFAAPCQSELWMRFGHGWDDGFPWDSPPGVSHPRVVPLWDDRRGSCASARPPLSL